MDINQAQVDKFKKDLKEYIEGSGVRLIFSEECFEFKHQTCLFSNDVMVPSKMLITKVTSLVEKHFKGYEPRFNNTKSSFWLVSKGPVKTLPNFE